MSALPSVIRAEIDLDAIRHNARTLRQLAGAAELMGVVKADAYGHGAVPVARALVKEGVEWLAVATVGEAQALREAGVGAKTLVFAAPLPEHLPHYCRADLRVTVSSEPVADAVMEEARQRGPLTVHVKVDTGMHRLGLAPAEAARIVCQLAAAPGVRVEGLWTHLATADAEDLAFVTDQLRLFRAVLDDLGDHVPPVVHVANGPALLRDLVPSLPAAQTLVRAGGILYGLASSLALNGAVQSARLRPAMRLASRVVHVQTVQAGETVSYGRTWVAERPTRIATIAAGYADGLPRAYRGPVSIGAGRYPVAGRVCMDMLMVDLGSPEGPGSAVRRGDEAVLFGPGGASAEEVADGAGTLAYELTSGLTSRVSHVEMG